MECKISRLQVVIGMDVAASEFYVESEQKYDLDFKQKPDERKPEHSLNGEELAKLYHSFIADYPIVSIEDGFDQDDWPNWTAFAASTGIQLVGDDLTVTNPVRIQKAIEQKACNCLLLKVGAS